MSRLHETYSRVGSRPTRWSVYTRMSPCFDAHDALYILQSTVKRSGTAHNNKWLMGAVRDAYLMVSARDSSSVLVPGLNARHVIKTISRIRTAAADDASQQKKARSLSLVLTLGDTTKQQQNQQPSPNGSQAPKIVLKDQKDKPHRPRGDRVLSTTLLRLSNPWLTPVSLRTHRSGQALRRDQ